MIDVLNGDLHKSYRQFLFPAVGSAAVIAAYSFVDSIAVGQGVGPNGTAAVAVVVAVYSIIQMIANIFGVGGSVLMSKARGEGKEGKANAYYTASALWTAVVTAAVWILLLLFQNPFYRFFGANELLMPYVCDYGKWIVGFFPVSVAVTFLGSFIRCDGNPRLVMIATVVGAGVNMFGDWLLVFPLNMGMAGAAIATEMGTVAQVLILVTYFFSKQCTLKCELPKKMSTAFKNIFSSGLGAGVPPLSVVALLLVANNQIMRYADADALATYGMINTVGSLLMGIFTGVGQAVQPIASLNFGAKQYNRCCKVCKMGFFTVFLLGMISTALCEAIPIEITRLFMKTTSGVEALAPYVVRVYGASFLPMALNIFIILYLQCVGKEKTAAFISLMRGLVLNCTLIYLLPFIMKINGVWWGIFIAEYAVGIFAVIYMITLNTRKGNKKYAIKDE